ncbi:MAG: membrane protein insertion efficiency factor YidD [Patescibacteria group bacterium]
MKKFLIFLIGIYQKTLSPDHSWLRHRHPGGYCKFTPTCSEYAKEAILKKGVIYGMALSTWRVLRCNPWSKGGFDSIK